MLIYLQFSLEAEEIFQDFSEDIFGKKYSILSPKHEDTPLMVSPGVSEQMNRNFRPFELESNICEKESEFSDIYIFFFLFSPKLSDLPR